jgi:hypothetical protein
LLFSAAMLCFSLLLTFELFSCLRLQSQSYARILLSPVNGYMNSDLFFTGVVQYNYYPYISQAFFWHFLTVKQGVCNG